MKRVDPASLPFRQDMFARALPALFLCVSVLAGVGIGGLAVYVSPIFAVFFLLAGMATVLFFYKQEYGLFALIFIAYTYTSNVMIVTFGLPSVMKPLIGLLVIIILFRWWAFKERPQGWWRTFVAFAGYGLIGLGSFFYAKDTYVVSEWLVDFAKDAVIAIVIAILTQRLSAFQHLIWILLISGIFLGSLNSYQALTGTFDNNYWGYARAVMGQIVGDTNDWRSTGPGLGPNGFGQIMVILVPFALERMWNEKKNILRLLAGWALIVCVLSVFYTYSRSAFLGLVVVLAAMVIYRRFNPTVLVVALLLFVALQSYLPAQYTDRLSTLTDFIPGSDTAQTADVSFRGRLSENLAAWRMFMDNPLLGVGLQNYAVNYQTYSREIGLDSRREARTPHNFYLEIASELGLLGVGWLIFFLWITFRGLFLARQELRNHGLREYEGLIVATGVSILGFLFTSIYQHLAYPRYCWLLFGIALTIPNVVRQELAARNQVVTPDATR